MDDDFKVIVGDCGKSNQNKAQRSVMKKSTYKGVSLNGKKWQVSAPQP